MGEHRTYLCIDLKSFYASVECVERGLDPMEAHLVVADPERTEKTICLAVSPALKELGVPNRCRVFQIPPGIQYVMAPPRMKLYMEYSARIYAIYVQYIAKEDIHVYSIDEAFMDVTNYLPMYRLTARELSLRIMQDICDTVGITAACGIGTNLYLAKVALDITAKHSEDHIGMLDEEKYRKTLWEYRPLTDFWRIGPGLAARLADLGIYTMGQLTKAGEDVLYKTFGIDAELLIDHAWGCESVTIADIKAYRPKTNCLSNGQVLGCDYGHEKGKLAAKEMADALCLELVEKEMATESITLQLVYAGGRGTMAPVHGTISMPAATSSARMILSYVERLYDSIETRGQPIQKIYLTFNRLVDETYQQYDLFHEPAGTDRERRLQKAMLDIKKKFGKNAVLKGMSLQEGATARERNQQIGGHKSGEQTENEPRGTG